jgi:uncharacterized membrane protein
VRIQFKNHLPSGETKPWTLREIIQGRPIDRVTHPMFVHFPIAFYIGALGLDVMSKLWTFPSAPLAATWLIIGAFAGTAAAALTGLVDRSTMKPGSRMKKVANTHMWVQFAAAGVFIVNFALRWSDRHLPESKPLWILLDLIGVLAVTIGADIGGKMVFKMGYRVGSSDSE